MVGTTRPTLRARIRAAQHQQESTCEGDVESYLENSPYLRAYPNPSNGPVFVVYEVPEGVEQALLEVVSADGKLIFSQSIAPQNGIAELGKLPIGLNVATLRCDGIRVGVAKLSIVR